MQGASRVAKNKALNLSFRARVLKRPVIVLPPRVDFTGVEPRDEVIDKLDANQSTGLA